VKKVVLIALGALLVVVAAFAIVLTRDGLQTTPVGSGTVVLDAGEFEAFPLPAYAAEHVTGDYLSYFVEVEPGIKVHVLEVGSGFPVYAQHGNPTSGFLYRRVAAELPTDRVRVIMPTLVGLGFSSKVPASAHTLDNHVRWMNEVLTQLELTEVVYVGQDWGGPVGMGALARAPGLLRGAVVMNTGLNAPREAMELSSAHARVRTPIVGEFMLEFMVSIFDQLHRMQGDPASIPAAVAELYGRPVRESGNVKAPVALMRMVTDGPQHPSAEVMREIEAYVGGLDIPAELVWGMNDPILAGGLPQMRANFPEAPVLETGAGHFLQEEVPGEIAAAIVRVLDAVLASREDALPSEPTPS
jgi:haloalkane dehalogenase